MIKAKAVNTVKNQAVAIGTLQNPGTA